MEVIGTVKMIGETQTFGDNGFRKRELVVTTSEQYPQHILLEFVQDKCDLLNNYQVGQEVKVHINLRGREWLNPEGETKYFNSIQGWSIQFSNSQPNEPKSQASTQEAFEPQPIENEEDTDDLPF